MPPYNIPLFAQPPAPPQAPMTAAMSADPRLAEFARSGVMPSAIQGRYNRDPRLGSAQEAMRTGASMAPVQSWQEGLARALQGAVGGYVAGDVKRKYETESDKYLADLAKALGGDDDLQRLAQFDPDAALSAALTRSGQKPAMVQAMIDGQMRWVPEDQAGGLVSDYPPKPDQPKMVQVIKNGVPTWVSEAEAAGLQADYPPKPDRPDKPKLVQVIRNGLPVWVTEDEAGGQQADYPPQADAPTLAQQATNAEIDAARRRLDALGLDPQTLLAGMQKQSDTGMDNPSYNPQLAHDVATAGQHKIGDDPDFQNYQSLFTAGASPEPVGDGTGDPALSGGVPSPSAGTAQTIPPGAIDMLRRNPNLAAMFDAKYGPGASRRYLTRGR